MTAPATQTYKRDQVERAVAKVTGRLANNDPTPDKTLKVDLKRLIDLDRERSPQRLEGSGRRYAFFDQPSGPGTDMAYTIYDAFALLIGERLMKGGLPQGTAVGFLRFLRRDLDLELDRILSFDWEELHRGFPEGERKTRLSYGTLVRDPVHKSYLVTPGGAGFSPMFQPLPAGELGTAHIFHGTAAQAEAVDHFSGTKLPIITIELVNMALQLRYWLERIPVRKRGRS